MVVGINRARCPEPRQLPCVSCPVFRHKSHPLENSHPFPPNPALADRLLSPRRVKKPQPKILVVDDEALIRESIKITLRGQGYELHSASNGEEALAKCLATEFDLVLTDYSMPGMKGQELAETLKKHTNTKLVLMLTAAPPTEPQPWVDHLLLKPFNPQMFRLLIADFLSAAV
jgi:CheY-like chemotaxis protein